MKSDFFKIYTVRGVKILALKDEDLDTKEPTITIMMEHPELDGRFTNTYTFGNCAIRDEAFENKIGDAVQSLANTLLDNPNIAELVKELPIEVKDG